MAQYYRPRLDGFAKRLDEINQRGRNLPQDVPDMAQVGHALTEAKTKLAELRAYDDNVPKLADSFAKEGKRPDLVSLVANTQDKNNEDLRIINDDLTGVELWLSRTEMHLRTTPAAPPPPPATEPMPAEEPAPAAAEPEKAAPEKKAAPSPEKKAPAEKKGAPEKKAAAPAPDKKS